MEQAGKLINDYEYENNEKDNANVPISDNIMI